MDPMKNNCIIRPDDPILITGATGFIGSRVLNNLLERGFRNLVCFVRQSSDTARLEAITKSGMGTHISIFRGNLLSPKDCAAVTRDIAIIYHLAAGGSSKSYPDAVMNTVVTTRNLLEATLQQRCLKRFVNVSSLAVYSNTQGQLLDERSAVEPHADLRGDAYCFAKVQQDEVVAEYGQRDGIPYVIVRPGYVYGPGKHDISSRVGIDVFGPFLHLGGCNTIPFTYVDNCAEAITLAGLMEGIDGEVFNIVDDDLPSSRQFLRSYKQNVKGFRSFYVPHALSYALCALWEWYANWSGGQLPPVFNRRRWYVYWKNTRYSNAKLKTQVGWTPQVPTAEGLRRYFESCRAGGGHA
jgi:nucleoside-diphosphate-sugar epimerase